MTLDVLRRIMPNLPLAKAQEYLPYLNQAMAEAEINTSLRQAAFLAQLAHESGEFKFMEELASGAEYEGRRDLGNVNPGDGVRYKGRGPIQLTGRSNYRAAGEALGIDLENNPQRAADPDVGFRTAAWFWTTHNLNQYADQHKFDAITLRVNGGFSGVANRLGYYRVALASLSDPNTPQPDPVPNGSPAVWGLVRADFAAQYPAAARLLDADMERRDQIGREKYGTPLQAQNGRDPVVDLYQELLDAAAYARQAIEEGRAATCTPPGTLTLQAETYAAVLRLVADVGGLVHAR